MTNREVESPPLERTEHFEEINGFNMFYRIINPNGPGVAFDIEHGGPGFTNDDNVPLAEAIARLTNGPVVLRDQRGSGKSKKIDGTSSTDDWRYELFVDDLEVFHERVIRQKLGLGAIGLIGHSWGGGEVADYIITRQPQDILMAGILSPLISFADFKRDDDAIVQSLDPRAFEILQGDPNDPEYERIMHKMIVEYVLGMEPEALPADKFHGWNASGAGQNVELTETMIGNHGRLGGDLERFDLSKRLGEMRVPSIWMVGRHDQNPVAQVRKFQSMTPGSLLYVVEDSPGIRAAHMYPLTHTELTAQKIVHFQQLLAPNGRPLRSIVG